ncbi:MAG TPA: endonuclease/exonuclease/phosphatase family protein [Stellaceae bacterium]|nr:endonuclease/exonuclease/phosphatase family protein [Stellaceae bacterium]
MKLITWNIQYGKGVDGRIDFPRIVETARRLADADVLCLQEIAVNFPDLDGGTGADQPSILAGLLPGYLPVFRPAIDYGRRDGARQLFGNMVLSRLPVLQVLPHLLPRPTDPGGRNMQRQALEVVIAAPFGPLRLITTHLEFYSEPHRRSQVDRLRALHAEAAERAATPDARDDSEGTYRTVPRPASTLVCGDFNFEPGWPEHHRLLAPFERNVPAFHDAWQWLHPGEPHLPTCGIYDAEQWPKGPNCRDFIFMTEDLARRLRRIEVDGKTAASDHQPVLVELD